MLEWVILVTCNKSLQFQNKINILMTIQFISIMIYTTKVNNLFWFSFFIPISTHSDLNPLWLLISKYKIKVLWQRAIYATYFKLMQFTFTWLFNGINGNKETHFKFSHLIDFSIGNEESGIVLLQERFYSTWQLLHSINA